jgi:hypothetical protein
MSAYYDHNDLINNEDSSFHNVIIQDSDFIPANIRKSSSDDDTMNDANYFSVI